jgi:iron-sulfur cluster repair protein YtfE (RIC family)
MVFIDSVTPSPPSLSPDWTSASIPELIEQIVTVHHARTRRLMRRTAALVRQIRIFPASPRTRAFALTFVRFESDVIAHLDHEEAALFPACLALDRSMHPGGMCGINVDVSSAIHVMSAGHDAVRQNITHLLDLAQKLPKRDKQRTVSAIRRTLIELDVDLIEHGRLEEEILLPAVMFQQELFQVRPALDENHQGHHPLCAGI